jgi:hypothetical protein
MPAAGAETSSELRDCCLQLHGSTLGLTLANMLMLQQQGYVCSPDKAAILRSSIAVAIAIDSQRCDTDVGSDWAP